jgi:hypothetical protein
MYPVPIQRKDQHVAANTSFAVRNPYVFDTPMGSQIRHRRKSTRYNPVENLNTNVKQDSKICGASQRTRNYRQRRVSHTDVDYVALSVNRNISIVPVFDLKDVASDRVSSNRLDEVQPGLSEGDRMFSTIFSDKQIETDIDFGPSHLTSRC